MGIRYSRNPLPLIFDLIFLSPWDGSGMIPLVLSREKADIDMDFILSLAYLKFANWLYPGSGDQGSMGMRCPATFVLILIASPTNAVDHQDAKQLVTATTGSGLGG
jgi:hypothetical protein